MIHKHKKVLKKRRTKSGLTKLLSTKNLQKPSQKLSKVSKRDYKRPMGRPKSLGTQTMEPKLGSREAKYLQRQWYDKLKSEGFKDLETFNPDHGFSDWLNNAGSQAPARIAMAYNTETETYYRRLTNFITHNPNWANDKMYHAIGTMYIVGISYRKMLPKLLAIGYKTNIWRIHHVIKLLVAKAMPWNKSHPEGLDFDPDIATLYNLKSQVKP